MVREIKARYTQGKIELLEEVDLKEGEELTVTIGEEPGPVSTKEAFNRAAGAWKNTMDFDAFLRDLYASRRALGRDVSL
ncbi:MAG: antitoxin family protein [Chloroflexi bacterium]|nr:antitoxin family protein [Chloroflexota bacterium]